MIIYNITTKVHHTIDAAWLQWQREEHIPDMMATGFFISHKIYHLLEHDDEEGKTYVIQYTASGEQEYNLYVTEYSEILRAKAQKKWGDKTISFRSLLEVMQ